MQNKKTDVESTTVAKNASGKGATVGSAVGHAIGAAADAGIGAIEGGLAAAKIAAGASTTKPAFPVAEKEFWRKEYQARPYYTQGTPYEQYGPAYQYGWESHAAHKDKPFKDVEEQLGQKWEQHRGTSKLTWNHAKEAAQDAWQRAAKSGCDPCGSV